ncbi:MAG: polysaccharide deacetylase family protein [Bacteroidetes bacterium]|nr:polysaccharide deacetylase family protein [Bacteroidota bacterium]
MKKQIILFLFFSFSVIGYSQILKKKIPDNLVVLTFDDATASQYSVVAPLLKQYGFGATFFVCEFPTHFKDSSKYMNWRQIKELDRMGFEVANHTHTHANVSKLSKEQFIAQLKYIEDKCDSLHVEKPSNFAYPGYGLSPSVIETLLETDYKFARAGGSRAYDPLNDSPLLLPSWATNSENKDQIMQAFKEAQNRKIVILTIHGVPDVEHEWVNTPPELFKEYLQYLTNNHFTVISLRELENYIDVKVAKKWIAPDFSKKLSN